MTQYHVFISDNDTETSNINQRGRLSDIFSFKTAKLKDDF